VSSCAVPELGDKFLLLVQLPVVVLYHVEKHSGASLPLPGVVMVGEWHLPKKSQYIEAPHEQIESVHVAISLRETRLARILSSFAVEGLTRVPVHLITQLHSLGIDR